MPGLFAAIEADGFYHGSAIMTPDGAMKARVYDQVGGKLEIRQIWRVGNNITNLGTIPVGPEMPFGSKMTDSLFERSFACVTGGIRHGITGS